MELSRCACRTPKRSCCTSQSRSQSGATIWVRSNYGSYLQEGNRLIVLLCGGDKSSQYRDIKEAHRIAEDWKDDEQDD